jgi:hypothetical protein
MYKLNVNPNDIQQTNFFTLHLGHCPFLDPFAKKKNS